MKSFNNTSFIGSLLAIGLLAISSIAYAQTGQTIDQFAENEPPAPVNVSESELQPDPWPETAEDEFVYIEVIDSCNHTYVGGCLNVRSGPGVDFPKIKQLRTGIVLKVSELVEGDEYDWYRIWIDEHLNYPERVETNWYVASEFVRPFTDQGVVTTWQDPVQETDRYIVVDRSEQRLYAYEGDRLFLETEISTGKELTPTPNGDFTVFKKTPARYMQGPIDGVEGSDYYDLPGVPWDLYFTADGAVIHGAYWHNNFGSRFSHGCVNVRPDIARELYFWAPLGIKVTVRD